MAIDLAAAEWGDGPPVAVLHGLFGSGRNWHAVAQRLAARHRVIALDLRNHGASPWAATMSLPEMADDVCAAMAARGHRRFAAIGHSLGGKVAMVAALTQPRAVEKLVVVDIAPVRHPTEPLLGYVQAMRGLDLGAVARRGDAETRLANAVRDPAERAFLLQNLVLDRGMPHWRLNLAAIEKAMPLLCDFPLLPEDTIWRGPALFVAGGRSDLLRPAYEPAVRARFPLARVARIAASGHWVQADQPDAFLALAAPFLADPPLG